MTRSMRSNVLLLLTAAIWGFAFVPQRMVAAFVPPLAFNGLRFGLGALSLLPLIRWQNHGWQKPTRQTLQGGVLAGLMLFFAALFQQVGLITTTAGNAGFITGLYVILVPILGMFWGSRSHLSLWIGAVLAVLGLYFLSISAAFTMIEGDLWVFIGAFFWAGQILVLERYAGKTDVLQLACCQFAVCALLSLSTSLVLEDVQLTAILGPGLMPILYNGLFSVGGAYTLQVVAQRDAHPAYAALILSLEGVFAAIAGWLLLGELLTPRGLLGCGLILLGLILAQVQPKTALEHAESTAS